VQAQWAGRRRQAPLAKMSAPSALYGLFCSGIISRLMAGLVQLDFHDIECEASASEAVDGTTLPLAVQKQHCFAC
jgi:hypothetical protein